MFEKLWFSKFSFANHFLFFQDGYLTVYLYSGSVKAWLKNNKLNSEVANTLCSVEESVLEGLDRIQRMWYRSQYRATTFLSRLGGVEAH